MKEKCVYVKVVWPFQRGLCAALATKRMCTVPFVASDLYTERSWLQIFKHFHWHLYKSLPVRAELCSIHSVHSGHFIAVSHSCLLIPPCGGPLGVGKRSEPRGCHQVTAAWPLMACCDRRQIRLWGSLNVAAGTAPDYNGGRERHTAVFDLPVKGFHCWTGGSKHSGVWGGRGMVDGGGIHILASSSEMGHQAGMWWIWILSNASEVRKTRHVLVLMIKAKVLISNWPERILLGYLRCKFTSQHSLQQQGWARW